MPTSAQVHGIHMRYVVVWVTLMLSGLQSPATSQDNANGDLAADRRSRVTESEPLPFALQDLEQRVSAAPNDLSLRTELLLGYSRLQTDAAYAGRGEQIVWIVAHAPDASIAASADADVDPQRSPSAYAQVRAAWLKQVEERGDEPAVLLNAARFFARRERPLATMLLKKGADLQPGRAIWQERLAMLIIDAANSPQPSLDPGAAQLALAELEPVLRPDPHTVDDLVSLLTAAELSRLASEDPKAFEYASRALVVAEKDFNSNTWPVGQAMHEGHRILGHIALNRGDVNQAKRELLLAGGTNGSPTLNTFGPNFSLAAALLARGETEVVLTYLEQCVRFWKSGQETLSTWIGAIRDGQSPVLHRFVRPTTG